MATFNSFNLQSVREGLSTVQATSAAASSQSEYYRVTPDGTRLPPQDAVRAKEATRGLTRLSLPTDTPPYYFKIDVQTYERKSWREVATVNPVASIVLPIPMNLMDAQSVDWEGEEVGFLGGSVLNGFSGADASAPVRFIKDAITRTVGQVAPGAVNSALGGQGLAINNYLTMMLKGPTYKRHDFTWTFSPRNDVETETLINIRRLIMDAQAPELYLGSSFFKYPCIFRLGFHHVDADLGRTLYRFKPAVLTAATFNHTPQGSPAFFSRTKAAAAVTVRMEFTELEFWLKGDYGSGIFSTESETSPYSGFNGSSGNGNGGGNGGGRG